MADAVAANGSSVEAVIWELFQSLLEAARSGNVAAAKFLIERLCGKDPLAVDLQSDANYSLSDLERATRIEAILDGARRRAEAAGALAEFLG